MLKPTPRVNPSGAKGVPAHTLRTLFEDEETPLLRYAFSMVGRRAVAEEIVQEVFLQLHIRWDEIEDPKAWLYRSVRNRVYNHVRDHRREVLAGENGESVADDGSDQQPDAVLLRMEAAGTLRKLLDGLNEKDRELVNLKYYQNLKYRDISDQTGLSISNVGYRLHHILKELAGKLRPLGIDEVS